MDRRWIVLLLVSLPFAFACASLAAGAEAEAGPPDPVGVWRGELEQEGGSRAPLQLVLHVHSGKEGLSATLDGLGATQRNLRVENLTFIEDVLSFQLPQAGVRFAGNFSPVGDSLRGTWSQAEDSRPLIFFRD